MATATIEQVDQAVAAARRAFPAWAAASPQERSAAIHRLADTFEKHTERLTASIVNEVGTPAGFAEVMQVKLGITHLRWQAEAALVDRTVQLGEWHDPVLSYSEVGYRPVGVVACITGYNYPINLAVFKFGAALAAGCTAVLLPSPRTPLTTLWMGELFEEAGIPPGSSTSSSATGRRSASTSPPTRTSTGSPSPAPTASAPRSWSRRPAG